MLWVKSKSPWNEPTEPGMWTWMSPICRSPRRKVRGSRLGSSWLTMRTWPTVDVLDGLLNWTVYGSAWPDGHESAASP